MFFLLIFQCFAWLPFSQNIKKYNQQNNSNETTNESFKIYVEYFSTETKLLNTFVFPPVFVMLAPLIKNFLKTSKDYGNEELRFKKFRAISEKSFDNISLAANIFTLNSVSDIFTKELRNLWSDENFKIFFEKIKEIPLNNITEDDLNSVKIKHKGYYFFLLDLYDAMKFFQSLDLDEEEKIKWKPLIELELPEKESYKKCITFFLALVE